MNASDILRKSAQHIDDRAAARDQAQGERSMARTVAAFNALTGHQLSERDGWLFMVQLKMARACTTPTGIPDDYEDGASYVALAGESVAGNDNAEPVFGVLGWVTWRGGKCPVDKNSLVDVLSRNSKNHAFGVVAGSLDWSHNNSNTDIIGYRASV